MSFDTNRGAQPPMVVEYKHFVTPFGSCSGRCSTPMVVELPHILMMDMGSSGRCLTPMVVESLLHNLLNYNHF